MNLPGDTSRFTFYRAKYASIAMIELAPNHKIGLSLANPVMIASGCAGYGNAYQPLLDLSAFGAIVTNPVTPSSTDQTSRLGTQSGIVNAIAKWSVKGDRQYQNLAAPGYTGDAHLGR
jgi:dihydroorotate dehydrogenase